MIFNNGPDTGKAGDKFSVPMYFGWAVFYGVSQYQLYNDLPPGKGVVFTRTLPAFFSRPTPSNFCVYFENILQNSNDSLDLEFNNIHNDTSCNDIYHDTFKPTSVVKLDSRFSLVWPNPVKNELNLVSKEKYLNYKLFTLNGVLIKTGYREKYKRLNFSGLNSGVYILSIQYDDHRENHKVVKL